MGSRTAVFVLLSASLLQAAEIRGKVVNAHGGEPLGRVEVAVLELARSVTTSFDGTFAVQSLVPGHYRLRLNAVGYRLLIIPVMLTSAGEGKDLSISMTPDNLRRTDEVEVRGDVFQGDEPAEVSQMNLTGTEIRESSTVVVDDPLRSVQTLPGVSAADNNEFFAQFSVMGAPFSDVSVYVDDVVITRPFHGIPGFREGASLSILTSETLEELKLVPTAYPVRYADAAGAALVVRTRDGSRTSPLLRALIGSAQSELFGEGDLGVLHHGSWLASARKSYLGYITRHLGESDTDVSFYDSSLKLTYDLTPTHSLSFYAVGGKTDASSSVPASGLGANDFSQGGNDFTLARLGWRFAATPSLLFDTRAAYIREAFKTRSPLGQTLNTDYYGEWVVGSTAAWSWEKSNVLQGGWTVRRLRDTGYAAFYSAGPPEFFAISNGTGLRQNGFVQQSSSFLHNRVHLLGGLRWDSLEHVNFQPLSSQVSAALQAAPSTQLQFGFGRYSEFPDFQQVAGVCTPIGQLVRRSNHYTAAVEQRLGEYSRIRVEAFDRQSEDWLGQRDLVFSASSLSCSSLGPLTGISSVAQRDYSRGLQFVLQRRSANRLSGWLGYTLAYSRQKTLDLSLPGIGPFLSRSAYSSTLNDQRHTLNVFASYRVTSTVNLSAKWLYGSGFPVTAGLSFEPVGGVLVPFRVTQPRLGPFQRLDLRADKSWAFIRWKMTLYGELLNVTNHNNPRLISAEVINPATGQAVIRTDKGLPITPTAGLAFEF
jgi:hypothetical protein